MVRRRSSGYAMLAALLIVVLGATFALVAVGAVHALQLVGGADAAAGRASVLQSRAITEAIARLRWHPGVVDGALAGDGAEPWDHWTAGWTAAPPVNTSPWLRRRLRVSASSGSGERAEDLTVELRAEAWATGVSCEGDAEAAAPLTVVGSGLYVGGCLRGRERVVFAPGAAGVTAGGAPVDGARGDGFAAAAAHAGAAIFAAGVEIHGPGDSAEYPDDGDPHTGAGVPTSWVAGPSAEFLAAARAEAELPGPAFVDGTLYLGALGPGRDPSAAGGRCLLLPAVDEVTIEGRLPDDAGDVVIVVPGDAVVGQPGGRVVVRGGLVVGGCVHVRSELSVEGSLHAGTLIIDAPTAVVVPAGWRGRLLPGTIRPAVVELGT